MRHLLSFMLPIGVWLFSTAIQSTRAQSTRPNDLHTTVVITKLAPLPIHHWRYKYAMLAAIAEGASRFQNFSAALG